MGLFDRFKRVTGNVVPFADAASYYGAWHLSNEQYETIMGLSPGDMWRSQPYLRTLVTFLARNVAQLGLQTFQRVGESDRQRLRDGVAEVLAHPNRATTSYELVYGLVADLALHDAAYWLIADDPEQRITRLPVNWVTPRGGDHLGPKDYLVKANDRGESAVVPAESVLAFHGWNPAGLTTGSSPVHALREILAEQVQAAKYRELVWRRGGKVGSVLSRPAGAPEWGEEARKQFKADWEARFTGSGPGVGGTPMLEDGMSLSRVDFSAHEMEFIEGSRLALNTVASVYHVNPTMIGLLDNANYSNVREFRRMLYGDTLGPILAQLEDRINTFLVPRLDARPDVYAEFNIEEKLQGSFEEQTAAIQSAVGRPWMTTNEARALRNMPAIANGDDLVIPLNVLVGGQASPTDTAPPQPPKASAQLGTRPGNLFLLKARASDAQASKVSEVIRNFLSRQGAVVLSGIGDATWSWDGTRWDKELTHDLHAVALTLTSMLGAGEAESLGFSPSDYQPEQTIHFLQSVAERYASNINLTTKSQLDVERVDGNPPDVFAAEAVSSRADGIARGVTTFLSAFATHEAASQIAATNNLEATKTWVTGANPRPDHAAMDGETVPLSQDFSNGAPWPGSAADADGVGCNCTLQVNV